MIGAALAALGLLSPSPSGWALYGLGVLLGVGNGLSIVSFQYALQAGTPPELVGRIFGIQQSASSAILLAAPLLGGLMIRSTGPSSAFLLLGTVTAGIGLIGLVLRSRLGAQAPAPAEKGRAA